MSSPLKSSLIVTGFSLALLLSPMILLGQGTIRGMITDSVTSTPLVGANVYLLGTALGSTTDLEGRYSIMRVPAGSYTLKVSYVGYKSNQHNVTVSTAEVTQDAQLAPDVILGPEVLVTAQARGQIAAINQQITSNTIVNVVSEERIQELPDVNAAEVIGRMPGVSILRSGGEANRVILRGLSDRFTSFTIDGVRIAPTDSNSRGVDLSMISQGSLAGIELFKALTSDQDGDAIAGSINLVTRKAPSERLLRLDAKGDYNRLMDTFGQYDFALRYGERFFDDVLGLQVTGNLERRNRSNERINLNYNQSLNGGQDYEISNFLLEFNNEIRTRNGVGVFLDVNTPDKGSIRFNTIYSKTKRDFLYSRRNYPYGTGVLVTYADEDRVQEIGTFNSSLHGNNYLLGLNVIWGGSFAQSTAEDPYDYYIDFQESSLLDPVTGQVISGMMSNTPSIKDHPETLIPYALNNFGAAYLNNAYYQYQKNLDKDKTAFVDLSRKFTLGSAISSEIKLGGKYKYKNRLKETSQLYAPYYLGFWRDYTRLPDGTLQKKSFDGTWFQIFYDRYVQSGGTSRQAFASDFLDPTPLSRDLYDKYKLQPIVNRDALKLWYDLNKSGVDVLGRSPEYYDNPAVDANFYEIVERVQASYIMNTLNIGQNATFITGVRVEREQNDYRSRFSPGSLGGFPIPTGVIRDTSATHSETVWLPNLQLTVRPTDFMNARIAAYRALSRPDFNLRLEKYVAEGGGGNVSLLLGNPNLRTAKAWNYEVNTSFFGNTIGLLSLSAFYKEIKDLYHLLSGAGTMGNGLIDSLGIGWKSPFPGGTEYSLTVPYNSSKPTRVWGFEFEHQINLSFLPGFFQNFVLSYNASIVRSETHLIATAIDTTYQTIPGFPFPLPVYNSVVIDKKQKLEGQPEFYGNISLGYDVAGSRYDSPSSIRLSTTDHLRQAAWPM
jgi:TonB-dependent receptor